MQQAPRVFISHASMDKERFVIPFAEKLRQRGIDAWLDKWEMRPGDSLVHKIFDEGIANAGALIVVLSENSVERPWVRAELNVGVVRRIEQKMKVIPVVLDNLSRDRLPESLRDTLWVRIDNLNSFDSQLESIVKSVLGLYDKPPLGESPLHVRTTVAPIPNLPRVASLALKLCYEELVIHYPGLSESSVIIAQMAELGIARQEAIDALEILERRHYIIGSPEMGTDIFANYSHTRSGIQAYIDAYVDERERIARDVIGQIVTHRKSSSSELASELRQPLMIINYVLEGLEYGGHMRLYQQQGTGNLTITDCSPELKYMLQDGNATF